MYIAFQKYGVSNNFSVFERTLFIINVEKNCAA